MEKNGGVRWLVILMFYGSVALLNAEKIFKSDAHGDSNKSKEPSSVEFSDKNLKRMKDILNGMQIDSLFATRSDIPSRRQSFSKKESLKKKKDCTESLIKDATNTAHTHTDMLHPEGMLYPSPKNFPYPNPYFHDKQFRNEDFEHQNRELSHINIPQSHPPSYPSSHPQSHPQSHLQSHHQSHLQSHPQSHSQSHPQSHPQSGRNIQPQQRAPFPGDFHTYKPTLNPHSTHRGISSSKPQVPNSYLNIGQSARTVRPKPVGNLQHLYNGQNPIEEPRIGKEKYGENNPGTNHFISTTHGDNFDKQRFENMKRDFPFFNIKPAQHTEERQVYGINKHKQKNSYPKRPPVPERSHAVQPRMPLGAKRNLEHSPNLPYANEGTKNFSPDDHFKFPQMKSLGFPLGSSFKSSHQAAIKPVYRNGEMHAHEPLVKQRFGPSPDSYERPKQSHSQEEEASYYHKPEGGIPEDLRGFRVTPSGRGQQVSRSVSYSESSYGKNIKDIPPVVPNTSPQPVQKHTSPSQQPHRFHSEENLDSTPQSHESPKLHSQRHTPFHQGHVPPNQPGDRYLNSHNSGSHSTPPGGSNGGPNVSPPSNFHNSPNNNIHASPLSSPQSNRHGNPYNSFMHGPHSSFNNDPLSNFNSGPHSSFNSGPHSSFNSGSHLGSHGGPHIGSHGGPPVGSHRGPHIGSNGGPYMGSNDGPYMGPHGGPHSGPHSGEQSPYSPHKGHGDSQYHNGYPEDSQYHSTPVKIDKGFFSKYGISNNAKVIVAEEQPDEEGKLEFVADGDKGIKPGDPTHPTSGYDSYRNTQNIKSSRPSKHRRPHRGRGRQSKRHRDRLHRESTTQVNEHFPAGPSNFNEHSSEQNFKKHSNKQQQGDSSRFHEHSSEQNYPSHFNKPQSGDFSRVNEHSSEQNYPNNGFKQQHSESSFSNEHSGENFQSHEIKPQQTKELVQDHGNGVSRVIYSVPSAKKLSKLF